MKKKTIFLILLFFEFTVYQAQTPHISGTVYLSINNGVISCDFEVSNIPEINGYSILLNTGLNVGYFSNCTDSYNYYFDKYYNSDDSYEAFQYYFPNDKDKRFLPKCFRISYIGAFPVLKDTAKMTNNGDWKGNIAFNGKSLRATEQSAWYPILYDTLNDILFDKVTYEIKVICEDCESVYINGSPPIRLKNSEAIIESNVPVQLMIFAGNYSFSIKNKTSFINTFLSDTQQTILSEYSNRIIHCYENNLKITYGYPVSFLSAEPISKSQSWMFVTYPTIAAIGHPPHNISNIFDENSHKLKDSSSIKYYSHELGHYYFGTYFVPNSELKWMFLEGFTEYISLQVSYEVLGRKYYNESIQNYINQINGTDITPLNTIREASEIDENYRYNYIPLLLTALEKEIGKEKMWNWLNSVLKSKNVKTNYAFFKSSLMQIGLTQDEFEHFENIYIKSQNSINNVITKVTNN